LFERFYLYIATPLGKYLHYCVTALYKTKQTVIVCEFW